MVVVGDVFPGPEHRSTSFAFTSTQRHPSIQFACPSANTIRSRHVDPGGVQEGSRGLSEATPPEHGPPHARTPDGVPEHVPQRVDVGCWEAPFRDANGDASANGPPRRACERPPAVVIDRGRYRGWGLDPIQADLEPLPGFRAVLGGQSGGIAALNPRLPS